MEVQFPADEGIYLFPPYTDVLYTTDVKTPAWSMKQAAHSSCYEVDSTLLARPS
jgi:hypothetical protein